MKKLLIGILLGAMYLLAGEGTDPTGTSIVNTKNLISYYGFANSQYTSISPIVTKIPKITRREFSGIEGESLLLDTPEEFITAAYFSPVQIQVTDVSLKASIEADLPHGPDSKPTKEAGLKLATMWLKKRAENLAYTKTEGGFGSSDSPNYNNSYMHAIDIIKEKTGVTDQEIQNFYAKAIEDEILRIAKLPVLFDSSVQTVYINKPLSTYFTDEQLRKTILRPLIKYYTNPTQENDNTIIAVAYYLQNKEVTESKGFIYPYYFILLKLSTALSINTSTTLGVYKKGAPDIAPWTPEMEAAKH